MYKVSTGRKVFKVIMNILLFPVMVASLVARGALWVIGVVTGFGIVRKAAWFALGFVALGSILGCGWATFIVFGIPLLFILAFPYIAEFLIGGCAFVFEKIKDYWATPAGLSYYDMPDDMPET